MLRRNARLRKEYLYRKSLEGKEKATYERKRQIRKALDGTQSTGLIVRRSCLQQKQNFVVHHVYIYVCSQYSNIELMNVCKEYTSSVSS